MSQWRLDFLELSLPFPALWKIQGKIFKICYFANHDHWQMMCTNFLLIQPCTRDLRLLRRIRLQLKPSFAHFKSARPFSLPRLAQRASVTQHTSIGWSRTFPVLI